MTSNRKNSRILVAEDNSDDFLLIRDAIDENALPVDLAWVKDGEELMDYLHHRGAYEKPGTAVDPELILLDLNMPRKNGFEALKEIKEDKKLRWIPIVVLSTSGSETDIHKAYELGINAYIRKPIGFVLFAETMKTVYDFWFGIAKRATSEMR